MQQDGESFLAEPAASLGIWAAMVATSALSGCFGSGKLRDLRMRAVSTCRDLGRPLSLRKALEQLSENRCSDRLALYILSDLWRPALDKWMLFMLALWIAKTLFPQTASMLCKSHVNKSLQESLMCHLICCHLLVGSSRKQAGRVFTSHFPYLMPVFDPRPNTSR